MTFPFDMDIPDWCPSGFTLYQYHKAMNLHFMKNSTYDFFKYNGKSRVNHINFETDPFRWSYATIERELVKNHRSLIFPLYMTKRELGFKTPIINKLTIKTLTRWSKASQDLLHDRILYQLKQVKSQFGTLIGLDKQMIGQVYAPIFEFGKKNSFCDETYLCYDMFIQYFLYKGNSIDSIAWPMILDQLEKKREFVKYFITENQIEEYHELC